MRAWLIVLLVFLVACQGVDIPGAEEQKPKEKKPEAPCPTDIKTCPDGRVVIRLPPDCDFEACPADEPEPVVEEEPEPELPPQPGCTDSDVGLNLNEAGITRSGVDTFTDECVGKDSVREYFCVGDKMRSDVKNCPGSRECEDGRCVVARVDVYTKCVQGQQRCSADDVEVCDNNGAWQFAGRCPYGCEFNTCITNDCFQPNARRCNRDNTGVERCNIVKAQWEFDKSCKFGCVAGECE